MFDDIREWISDNLRYIALGAGALLVLIIIVSVVRLIGGSGSSKSTQTAAPAAQQTAQNTAEAVEETTEQTGDTAKQTAASEPVAAASGDLVRDDAAVLTLAQQYYTAVAEKDTRTLSSIVTPWDDTVQAQVLSHDGIEAYQNIRVYSKKGRKDGEYVVFAASEIKLADIETTVPNLDMMYLVTGAGGKLQVASNMSTDAEISAYVTQAASSADVQTLVTEINNSYAQALAKDEQLSQYISNNAAEVTVQTGDDTDVSGTAVSDDAEDQGQTQQTTSSDVKVGATMAATTTINIRQTASTGAAIMGVLPEGTSITVLADGGNGWVQISYSTSVGDIVGFVMSDYLTSAGSAALSNDAAADTAQ